MKKIVLFIAAAAIGLLAFNSCNDHDLADVKPDVPSVADVDYLVMYYAAGGGNLDSFMVNNIVQAMDEGRSDKVAMTFQYKLSKKLQTEQSLKNLDGTRRFTLDDNAHLQGQLKSLSKDYPLIDKFSFDYYVDNIKSEKIGGSDYDLSNPENLAEFISWSKKKYPKAKRTILVINGHGNGWWLADGKAQFLSQKQSRVILPDDNLENKTLKAVDVVNGANKGGGVDMLYTDACLMAMYENIYTYANAFKYLLAAGETTPGIGGDYRKLLNLLKSAGTTDAELEEAIHKYADHCVTDQWWGKRSDGEIKCCDIGLYNLSKLGTLTPVMQKIASTLTEKFTGTESIEPTADELPLSDKFAPYIRKSATQCVALTRDEIIKQDSLPAALLPYLRKDLPSIYNNKYFLMSWLIRWARDAQGDNAQAAYEAFPEEWAKLRQTIIKRTFFSFSLTDFLTQIDSELSAVGAQNNPFGKLHDELFSALKSVAYIACTEPEDLPVEQAYEYCSPGIYIIPLNETYKTDDNPYYENHPNVEESLSYYQVSDFDKAVGWSNFLKVIDVMPSVLHNPDRQSIMVFPDGTIIR